LTLPPHERGVASVDRSHWTIIYLSLGRVGWSTRGSAVPSPNLIRRFQLAGVCQSDEGRGKVDFSVPAVGARQVPSGAGCAFCCVG
jgi:hypothetical protein